MYDLYKTSQDEYNAYRAIELARDSSISLDTIFKSTGGYRQSVVDERTRIENRKNRKK